MKSEKFVKLSTKCLFCGRYSINLRSRRTKTSKMPGFQRLFYIVCDECTKHGRERTGEIDQAIDRARLWQTQPALSGLAERHVELIHDEEAHRAFLAEQKGGIEE